MSRQIYSTALHQHISKRITQTFLRTLSWAKDNGTQKWVVYNRIRGQYMSALEHAIPERFFNDSTKCNLADNLRPSAGLPNCPQGVSAVKAIAVAAAQGQKIYTITQVIYKENPTFVQTALASHSYSTKQRIQQSLESGNEVVTHERPVTIDE